MRLALFLIQTYLTIFVAPVTKGVNHEIFAIEAKGVAQRRKKVFVLGVGLLGLFLTFWLKFMTSSLPPSTVPATEPEIEFQSYDLPHSLVRVVSVPASRRWEVRAGTAPGVQPVEDFATKAGAVVAINAGFFDPNNQKSTSYVFRDRQIVANPEENDRLTGNPQLEQYLPQIFNRTEWRRYQCGDTVRYGIAPHREPPPEGCELVDAIGAGPQLLPELTAEAEAFVTPNRDPIGINRRNARSAIAIKEDGSLLFAIASQKPDKTDSGLSLSEFAEFLRGLGTLSALNLDGGSSTALYYRGQTFYGKLDEAGNAVKRPVKSVLFGKAINASVN